MNNKYATLAKQQISIKQAAELIVDDSWVAQQKFDGRRILIDVNAHHVHINNRTGVSSVIAPKILDQLGEWLYALSEDGTNVVFDGEWVDNAYHVFDIKSCDLHTEEDPYYLRWANLRGFISAFNPPESFKPVYTAFSEEEKLELVKACEHQQAEGIIFRKFAGSYIPGRTDNIKKFKFVRLLDAVVIGHVDGRASVELGLVDEDKVFPIGHCSTLFHSNIHVGDVIEVEYLFFSPYGKIIQPIFRGVREDKDVVDCTFDQVERYQHSKVVTV